MYMTIVNTGIMKKNDTVSVTDSTKYAYNNFTFNNETGQFTVHGPIKCDYDAIPSSKYILRGEYVYLILSIAKKLSSYVIYNAIRYAPALAINITGDYVQIVGNGESDTERSNAYTLDWKGNAWFSGDVYVGSTSGTNKDNGSVRLATVEDLLFCFRFLIEPAQNEDGTINYISDVSALFILRHVLRNVIADAGNSIECLLPLSGDDVAVLNFTETYMNILADGNMAIGFKFSSYVSGKHISAEIKDTISGFNTDDEKILSTVVTVTENASLPTPATAQVGQIVKVKAVDADGKVTETEADDLKLILKSSTEGSAKKFKITVNDSGTISATEITETPA